MTRSTQMITRLAIAIVLAAATVPALADGAANRAGEPRIKVRFADLDLTVPGDVAALYSRIKVAARLACVDSSSP
jgi:UrcA family protein